METKKEHVSRHALNQNENTRQQQIFKLPVQYKKLFIVYNVCTFNLGIP